MKCGIMRKYSEKFEREKSEWMLERTGRLGVEKGRQGGGGRWLKGETLESGEKGK